MCVCVCLLHYFRPKCIVKIASFSNAPVKISRLSAGVLCVFVCECVCVCLCVIPRRQYSTFKVTGGFTAIMMRTTENGWIM